MIEKFKEKMRPLLKKGKEEAIIFLKKANVFFQKEKTHLHLDKIHLSPEARKKIDALKMKVKGLQDRLSHIKNASQEEHGLLSKTISEDEDFISDSRAALLTQTTPVARSIIYAIITFVLVMLIWAYFAPIDQVTVAEGKVIPSSQVKVIQSLDGGLLLDIPIKEGALVKKGQVLVVLDNTRYKADYDQGLAKYYALLATIARSTAETKNQSTITFPTILLHGHDELITNETNLFQARKQALASQVNTLKESYNFAKEELNILGPMVKKGIVPKIDYLRSERTANELKRNMLDVQDKFREGSLTDLNARKADLATLTEQLISLRDKMVRTTIRSPVSGVVKKIYIVTVGGVIQPGAPIMDVVPLEDYLLIQGQVKPADIAFVHVGQVATVKISAYDYSIYGSLPGIVEYVSADAIEDPKASPYNGGNNTYYTVNVRTDRNYLGSASHKLPIMPGMNATVNIVTGEKTILQYIMKPLIKAKTEALRER